MKKWFKVSFYTLALAPIALSVSQPAQAFDLVRRFTSFLDAGQEVTFSDSTATGKATLDLFQNNDGDYALKYEVNVTPELDFTKLKEADETTSILPADLNSNDIIFFHLHAGAQRGANGSLPYPIKEIRQANPDDSETPFTLATNIDDDLVIDITPEGTTLSGFLEEDKNEFAASEAFPDFDSLVDELLSVSTGDTSLYWNIHSFKFPSGAIRGQVEVKTPEPTSLIGLLTLGFLGLNCVKNRRKSYQN